MLTYALLAAYVIIACWVFYVGRRNGATVLQGVLVSLGWPLVIPLVLVLLLADNVPDDT